MTQLRVVGHKVGAIEAKCFFALNEETGEIIIIDPGADEEKLAEEIEKEAWKPCAILLTHGHFDHAGAAAAMAKRYGIAVYAQECEREVLENPDLNLSFWEKKRVVYHADYFLKDGQEIDLAGFHIRVIHTPGHTAGGACYYFPYQDVLFSGDTLFAQSIGRTDFPTGSGSKLIRSIKEKLMTLPEETIVYTGHGENTAIRFEQMFNPYL